MNNNNYTILCTRTRKRIGSNVGRYSTYGEMICLVEYSTVLRWWNTVESWKETPGNDGNSNGGASESEIESMIKLIRRQSRADLNIVMEYIHIYIIIIIIIEYFDYIIKSPVVEKFKILPGSFDAERRH